MVACAGLALLGALRADPVDLAGADLRVEAAGDLAADGYVNTAGAAATLTLAFNDDVAALPPLSGAIRLVKLGVGTVTFPAARAYTGGEKAERCPSLASLFPPQAAVGSAAVRIHPCISFFKANKS